MSVGLGLGHVSTVAVYLIHTCVMETTTVVTGVTRSLVAVLRECGLGLGLAVLRECGLGLGLDVLRE